jgi:hypothetical protein
VNIANQLQIYFPTSKIFRFEGDDFFIISQDKVVFSKDMIHLEQFDTKGIIKIITEFFEINSMNDLYKIEKYFKIK